MSEMMTVEPTMPAYDMGVFSKLTNMTLIDMPEHVREHHGMWLSKLVLERDRCTSALQFGHSNRSLEYSRASKFQCEQIVWEMMWSNPNNHEAMETASQIFKVQKVISPLSYMYNRIAWGLHVRQ